MKKRNRRLKNSRRFFVCTFVERNWLRPSHTARRRGPCKHLESRNTTVFFYSASTISSKLDGRGIIKKDTLTGVLSNCLRKERDSNPRCLSARRFSRPVYSTTLPSFLTVRENWLWSKASAKVMPFFGITKFFAVFFIYLFADASAGMTYSAVSSKTRLA